MPRHVVSVWLFVLSIGVASAQSPLPPASQEDLPEGALLRLGEARLPLIFEGAAIAISPEGKTLAVEAGHGLDPGENIYLFDLQTGKQRQRIPAGVVGRTQGLALWFSRDGASLWFGGEQWDTTSWQPTRQKFRHSALAAAPDEKFIALHGEKKSEFEVRSVEQQSIVATAAVSDTDNYLASAVFAPDGKTLAVTDYEGRLQLREIPSGKLLHNLLDANRRRVGSFSFSPDGKLLAVPIDYGVNLFDVASGRLIRTCNPAEPRGGVCIAKFTPSGTELVGGNGINDEMSVWNPATGELTRSIPLGSRRTINDLAFSSDGRILAIVSTRDRVGPAIRVFDWNTKQELLSGGPLRSPVQRLAYSPDSRQLVTATADGLTSLWNVRDGRFLTTLHDSGESALAFSPDGWILGVVGREGSYHLRLADTGEDLVHRAASSQRGIHDRVSCVALTPQISALAIGSDDGRLRIQATATGEERGTFQLYSEGGVASVAWSHDGKRIATARYDSRYIPRRARPASPSPDGVQIWDATSGRLMQELVSTIVSDEPDNRSAGLGHLAFSPDGRTLAALHASRSIVLWDLASGRQFLELPDDAAAGYCFSSDGRMLLCVSGESTQAIELASAQARLRRSLAAQPVVARNAPRNRFRAPRINEISALAIAPDCRTFATAVARDNSVLIWSLLPDDFSVRPASELELGALWETLAAADAPAAYSAMWRMIATGDAAVAFVGKHFGPVADPKDQPQIQRLIEALDDDDPRTRDDATDKLSKLGAAAEPLLRARLTKQPSLEQRKRIEQLLATLDGPVQRRGGEILRRIRAIEVLERIDGPVATKLLERLAAGSPTARETREAQLALERRKSLAKKR